MITLKEYAKVHGISVDTVRRRIKSGEVKQIKKDGKYFIFEPNEIQPGGQVVDREKLRDAKLMAEIKLLRQRDKENESAIRADDRTKFKEALFVALKDIPAAFRDAKLSEDQFKVINSAFDEGIKKLEAMK